MRGFRSARCVARERREAMHGRAPERLAGAQHRRGEVGAVGRIGKVLGLETDAVALPERLPFAADEAAVELVAGVALDAGLCRLDLEDAAAGQVVEARRAPQRRGRPVVVEDPVVVVAARAQQLLGTVTDAL